MFTAALFIASCRSAAPPPLTDAERTALADSVKQMMGEFFAVLDARDVQKMWTYYVPGEELTTAENGMFYPSRDSIERAANAFWGSLRSADFTDDANRVQVLGRDVVIYTSQWHGAVTDTTGKTMEMRGAWSSVLQRRPEGWKIVQEHGSAPVPPPAPTPQGRRRA